jgi:PAS domain S-box-containing protein
VDPETSVLDAIALMAKQGKSTLVGSTSQILGWLTEKDVVRLVASEIDLRITKISQVMHPLTITLNISEVNDLAKVLSQLRQLQLDWLPVVDEQGQLIGIITRESIYQVLEQQETREQYKQAEEQLCLLESAIANINDAILITEAEAIDEPFGPRIIYANTAFTRMCGYTWGELIGKTPRLLQGEQTSSTELAKIRVALQSGLPIRTELINYKKNGSTYWVELNILPIANQAGNITHFVSIEREITQPKGDREFLQSHKDITASQQIQEAVENGKKPVTADVGIATDISQQQAALRDHQLAIEALKNSEERFRNLVEASSDLIWEVDKNAIYTYVSPKVRDILGYEPEEVLGKSPVEFMPLDRRESIVQDFAVIFITPQPFQCLENIQIHHNGHLVWLETSGVPIFDSEGTFQGYRGISRDITQRQQAETSLQNTQQQLQAILDNSPAVIYVIDTDNRFLLVNSKYEQLFNTTQEQIFGKSIYDVWNQDIANQFAVNNHQVITNGIPVEAEEIVPHPDGLHTYLSIKFPLKDASGVPYAICGISTDITERKLVEESLLRFRKAIESTSDAVCMGNIFGETIYVNPAFLKLYEYTLEELQTAGGGKAIFKYPAEFEQVVNSIQSGESWRGEVTMQVRSGRILQVYLCADAFKDATGKVLGVICIHTDITQRKLAEESLRLRDRAIAASSNGIIIADASIPNGAIIYVNSAYERMTGYCGAEVIGKKFCLFQNDEIQPQELEELKAAMQAGKDCTVILRNHRRDSGVSWNELHISPVYDVTGTLTHYIGIQTDITERKQLEQELIIALEKEKELNELKSRFISMTSHEFRTPLSTILSSTELLEHYRHKWTEDKQLTHLRRIQTAVKRMTEMLNDILFIGKAEAGILDYKPTSFDLVEYCCYLVEEVELDLNNQRLICFSSQPEVIPCFMDKKLLGHILSNLLSNALKYSPSNTNVEFTLTCENGQAIFEIQDQGIGIPAEDIPHLFESFHRASNVGNIIGTGLGLAIVKKCVDTHQGKISLATKLGVGTKFTITLPLNN